MLPSKGYFKGVKCPDQSKGGCQRPFCHFRHEPRPETDSTAGTSSASVNENPEFKTTSNSKPRAKDVIEETVSTASSSSSDMIRSSSAVESISSNVAVSGVKKVDTTMAIQPEMIQQLVNAAVQKVIAENPALAAGPVDTAAIMQSIDTSAIVALATQSMAAKLITSTDQTENEDMIDSTNTDQTLKTKKKLYLRPPNAPAYNPTPIKELEKRKLVIDDKGSSSPTLTPIRSRLLDDVIESESNSKGSGVESELTDFSASSEDEEDKEKRRSEFDILEEVLAEHSKNNKNNVKKKKKKALGKLQYSNSPTKFIDESSLISDARDVCENDFSIDIDKTPKRKSKQAVKDKADESDPTPYFLPPSPVFTGASCDGYSNSGAVYTDPYSSNNTSVINFLNSYDKEEKTDSENDEINKPTSNNKMGNNESKVISNDKLTVSGQSNETEKPRQGHALLCQLVQNPIRVSKLSRQNVSAWLPGAKKVSSVAETDSTSGDLLEAMVSNFDGAVSQTPVLSTDKEVLEQSSKVVDLIPSKLAEAKSHKVDLNKEIQSLNKQKEFKILTEGEKENQPKDLEDESKGRADKVLEIENKNESTEDNSNKNKYQELIVKSNAKKQKARGNDHPGSESEGENNENKDGHKNNKSDENKNKKEKHKKSQDKKEKYRSHSESESDEPDASAGKGKKKHKKKKKRSRKKSDSEEESSDEENSDKDVDNDSIKKTTEINGNEKKLTGSKDKSKENRIQELGAELNDKANNKECKEHLESDSEGENHENKKSDKKMKSDEKKNKKEKHRKSRNKKKKHRSRSDSEDDEESDVSAGKERKKHKKKKKRRSHKKSDSEDENSDEESSDKDQEKKGRKQKNKRKGYNTDESEANTDEENTDKKSKSKSVERMKEKDESVKEKDNMSHSDSDKDNNKDELDSKTKSTKIHEKASERRSRSRDKKSEDRHTDAKKVEPNVGLEKKDKDEVIEKEKKKRKRSSSSDRSSSRHRSSSRKHKKKRRGNKHKKKRGRKHKKRKYSRSDSEESDDDSDEEKSEETDEESDSSEEKDNKSKEKGKRHKTSKHLKRSSKNKKKGRHRRNKSRSSSESSSRSSSRSKSRSKSREKKRRGSQSKEERKKSTEISILMPVDPSKIKEEKIDFIDLTKVKIEKLDDQTMNLDIDIKKTNTGSMQLPCMKTIKEEKNSDNEEEKEMGGKKNEKITQKSINTKLTINENHKISETKSSDDVDPVISKRLLDKEDSCITSKERRKSVDARRDSGDRSKEKNKDKENSYSKSKDKDRIESNKSQDKVVKESEPKSTSNKHKVDLDKEIEKLHSKSNKSSKESDKPAPKESDKPAPNESEKPAPKESEKPTPPSMSIFDMVLASNAATPTKKVLKEVSMFDTAAASNNDFISPPSSPEHSPGNTPGPSLGHTPPHSPLHSPGHLPDSPSFDYNSKFTDPPGIFSFDGIKRRKSSSDEKDTSKEKRKDKDNVRLKDKMEDHKEDRHKEIKKTKNEPSKDKHSKEKERQSKSKEDHNKGHRISSSSNSQRSSKEESKHSSSRSSSSSKHKESSHSKSSSSSSSSHTKKKDDSKSHSSNSKDKSDKETEGKSSKHISSRTSQHTSSSNSHHTSSSSSHSSKKHSSSSSKSSSSSSKKNSSSTSSSSKRKEMLFDDLLNQPKKKLKTEKVKSRSDHGLSKNLDSDDGGDSPMPDLSALDDIADDDWNQIINPDKPQKYDDYSHLENLKSDESDEDELADLDDPSVMEECKQMFDDYEPPLEETIRHSKPKERKVPQERLKAEIPAGKQRIARAPSSGSSTGNLIVRPKLRNPKMTPTQMMMERYKKLKEKAEELNKLVKTQEAQLKKQKEPSDYPTKVESKHTGLSSAIVNKPSGKPRIAHVPNVSGLLQARDQIKSLPPSSSRSLLSAQASRASGSAPSHTQAITNVKGAKRVAHTPALETFSRPTIPVESSSKVPQNVRQRYLNTFIDDCLKFCESQAEAFSKAMAEEKVCFNRATSRSIYLNLAVNTIKRLRMNQISDDAQELLDNDPQYSQDNFENHPSTSSGRSSKSRLSHPPSHKPSPMSPKSHFTTIATGGNKGSWSIEKVRRTNSEVDKLRGLALYKHLKTYILNEEGLESNGYPRPDPDEKGKAVIKAAAHRKKISPSSTERHCDRCKVIFIVDKWGFPTSTEPCRHHWGRAYKQRGPGGLATVYSCCSGDMTAEGCNIASTHVSQNFNPKELRGYVRTLPKNSKHGDFGIYALDCEMCYTTNGNELTRVTIIDSEDNMVYDTLVKPDNPIIDYNTRFSGITEEDMENVTTTIREVQTSCLTRFNDRTILVGHSLESDLHALKIIHDTVIDTSVVFPHKMGPPYKRALRNLASELLKRIIQQDVSGHDSKEDASAAMDLMHWKVKEDLKMKK